MISLLYVLLKGSIMNEVAPKFFDIDSHAMIGYVLPRMGYGWPFAWGRDPFDLYSADPWSIHPLYLTAFLRCSGMSIF
jgi:hypothetical protein